MRSSVAPTNFAWPIDARAWMTSPIRPARCSAKRAGTRSIRIVEADLGCELGMLDHLQIVRLNDAFGQGEVGTQRFFHKNVFAAA